VDRTKLRFPNAAEVRDFNPLDHFEERAVDFLDRFAQFALVSAREAAADAGLATLSHLRERTAIVTGSGIGGQTTQDDAFQHLYLGKRQRLLPLTVPRVMPNAGASHIAIEFGITCPAS